MSINKEEDRNRSKSRKRGINVSLTPSKFSQNKDNSSNNLSQSSVRPINQLPLVPVVHQPNFNPSNKPVSKVTFNYITPVPHTSQVSEIQSEWVASSAIIKQSPVLVKQQRNLLINSKISNKKYQQYRVLNENIGGMRNQFTQQNNNNKNKEREMIRQNSNVPKVQYLLKNIEGRIEQKVQKQYHSNQRKQANEQKQLNNQKWQTTQKQSHQKVQPNTELTRNSQIRILQKNKQQKYSQIRPSVFNIVQEISQKVQMLPTKKSQTTKRNSEQQDNQKRESSKEKHLQNKSKKQPYELQKIQQKIEQGSSSKNLSQYKASETKQQQLVLQEVHNNISSLNNTLKNQTHPKVNIQRIREAQQRLKNIIKVCDHGLQS